MIKDYSDKLPRKLRSNNKNRCSGLDMDGNLCNKKALYEISYHGDHQLYYDWDYGETPVWVRVYVCGNCITDRDKEESKK